MPGRNSSAPSGPGPARPSGRAWAALAVILAVAAGLRLYALGTPQLLHDEALVASAALHDLGYILRRALFTDAHPPYYYAITKFYMLAGTSEWVLRLASALAGIGAVFLLYRLGRRIAGTATGLFAAALLAVHQLHVELSRVLRPHSLIILLTIAACWFFLDLMEKRDRGSVVKLTLVNAAMLVLHFNAVLVIGAQMALMGFFLLGGWLRPRRAGFEFLAACLLLLPVNLWFLAARLGKFSGVDTNCTMAWTATRTLANFDALLTLAPLPWADVAGWLLAASGFFLLARVNRPGLLVVAAFALLPPAALILARYGIIYEPWHVAFLVPFLLLACGHALSRIPLSATALAPALALGAGACLLTLQFSTIYGPSAYMFNHNLGQRDLAQALAPRMGDNLAVAFSRPEMRDFTNWYLPRGGTTDLTRFSLSGTAPAGLTLVSPTVGTSPDMAGARLAAALGTPRECVSVSGWTLRRWDVPRSPVLTAPSLPYEFKLPADLERFLAQAVQAKDVVPFLSPLGDGLAPSVYDAPATFSYRIENRSGTPAPGALLRFDLANSEPGNLFCVSLSLDGQPPFQAATLSMAPFSGSLTVAFKEPHGFTTLDVFCTMVCSSRRPSFNNVPDTITYNGMTVSLDAADPAFASNVPLVESGLNAPEQGSDGPFRWGIGPESQLFFVPPSKGQYVLEFSASSPMPGQAVDVTLDGAPVATVEMPRPGETVRAALPFTAEPGNRLLGLRYRMFNHGPGGEFAPADGRNMAVAFKSLRLRAQAPERAVLVFAR